MKWTLLIFLISSLYAQNYRLDQTKLPKFELGVGASFISIPYYPGSKERRDLFAPYPTFIYRGDKVRADEDGGLRGRFFKSERFEINTSFGLFLPVDNDDISAREGMNDLGAMIEAGPGLIYHLIPRSPDKDFSLSLNLGLRAALSTDIDDTYYRGLIFNPMLYSWYKLSKKVVLFNALSTTLSTKEHQSHFYEVAPSFGNSKRQQYSAKGGFFSHNISSFALYTPTSSFTYFAGLFYQNFSATANRNSPLHLRDSFFSAAFGITYWFYQSKDS